MKTRRLILRTCLYITGLAAFATAALLLFFFKELKGNGLAGIPTNNLSNSVSYNSKMQHFREHLSKDSIEFLIVGSSMSLNNISAEIIQKQYHAKTYNFSSWGFSIDKSLEFLEKINFPNCKQVLIAFNNYDFTPSLAQYDIGLSKEYINKTTFSGLIGVAKRFNVLNYKDDWETRNQFLTRSNSYSSLKFDQYGSALIDSTGFIKDFKRCSDYKDTTGFARFRGEIDQIKQLVNSRGASLTIVYLPWRKNILTSKHSQENDYVANMLRNDLGLDFIDLHNYDMDTNLYCDAGHLFRYGAVQISQVIVDSIRKRQQDLVLH